MNDLEAYPIVYLDLKHIDFDPDNAYEHNDAEIQRLVGSISEYGFIEPVVVHAEYSNVRDCCPDAEICYHYTLVGGEGRVDAARSVAGIEKIPAIMTTFDPVQRKAVALALNGKYGHWDETQLRVNLMSLEMSHYDLDLTGLEPFHIKSIMDPDSDKEGQEQDNSGGFGEPVISYNIIFDDDTQQQSWYRFVRFLKDRYQGQETLGQRLAIYVAELEMAI